MKETATFGLVPDTTSHKVALAVLLPVVAMGFIVNFVFTKSSSQDELVRQLFLPISGCSICCQLMMEILTNEADQLKRLRLNPEGVAYLNGDQVEWRVGWDELQSVAVRKTKDWANGNSEDLIFYTTSGTEQFLPIAWQKPIFHASRNFLRSSRRLASWLRPRWSAPASNQPNPLGGPSPWPRSVKRRNFGWCQM
ncbi:MAG: hypothetical protein JST35_03760 [Armatimonadetes bacterium]|nr:hypothetical protein [Armatimonadota bacterium]